MKIRASLAEPLSAGVLAGVVAGAATGATIAKGADATVWLTAALVTITGYYAVLTHRLADEATQARQDERDRDRQRLEAAAMAARRGQAERIAAWCTSRTRMAGHLEGAAPGTEWYDVVTVTVRNPSDLPIYGIFVAVATSWSGEGASIGDQVDVLGPRGDYEAIIQTVLRDPAMTPPIELHFVDVANVAWLRRPDGTLIEDSWRPGDARPVTR